MRRSRAEVSPTTSFEVRRGYSHLTPALYAASVAATPDAEILVLAVRDRKVPVIRIVQSLTGMRLADAVELVDHPPFVLPAHRDQVERLCGELRAVGCAVGHRFLAEPVDEFARLERLGELHDQGVLNDEEFAAAKRVLLDRI
jgi:ribosomal protein L7/L12